MWDITSGAEVRRFEGHTDKVGSVAFVPLNRRFHILSFGDRTARLWDPDTGRELYRSPELSSAASCGAFVNLDGIPSLVIGTERDGLQLWRLPQE
jgi:WD40 repeat protein